MTEWNADEYARRSALQDAMAAEVLARLDFAGAERVLDVGWGDGKITAAIAGRVPAGSVLGVDPSRDMIAHSVRLFGSGAVPNLGFEIADARSLPFEAEFDRVVSFNALHWVQEQDAVLSGLRRALKPGGFAWLRLVPAGERRSLEDVLGDTRQTDRWAGYFPDFRRPFLHPAPEDYRAAAERQGFRVRLLEVAAKAWDFQSRPAFRAFGEVTFVEWLRCVPEPERPAFIDAVLDRYHTVAADRPGEEHVFKFYQMDVELEPV